MGLTYVGSHTIYLVVDHSMTLKHIYTNTTCDFFIINGDIVTVNYVQVRQF